MAQFYRKKFQDFEVEFHHDNDQYSTDFDKAIDVVKDYEKAGKVSPLFTHLILDEISTIDCRFGKFERPS